MPDLTTLALFTAAAMALIVVPGPAVLYIVAQSVDGGRRAGLVSALGIATGGLVHVVAAAVGLSSLVLSSATAFTVVKYAGAAYLVVLGIRRLLERDEARVEVRSGGLRRIYGQGVVVNVLNPKTALFFFAFLPQFVDVGAGHVTVQLAVFGLLFVALALVSDSVWALVAGTGAGVAAPRTCRSSAGSPAGSSSASAWPPPSRARTARASRARAQRSRQRRDRLASLRRRQEMVERDVEERRPRLGEHLVVLQELGLDVDPADHGRTRPRRGRGARC